MKKDAPILGPEEIESRTFLDHLRGQLHGWSLTLYDPSSGGFRLNERIEPSVLSTTDVVWIRYAVNDPDPGAPDREAVVEYLQGKQHPETGRVRHDPGPAGQGHSDGHAFWQTVRALRILGARLLHFPAYLQAMMTPSGLDAWFRRFDWDGFTDERRGNHREILGLVPVVASLGDDGLTDILFRNIATQQNPETGTWPRAGTNISRTFAYTALHMAVGRLPNMPEAIINEILRLQKANGSWDAELPSFGTMDAAYVLVRLPPRIGRRQGDAEAALRRLSAFMRRVYSEEQPQLLSDTHRILAVTHTFGLLQEAFSEEHPSARPFRFDWDKLDLYVCDVIARIR